MKKWIIAFTLLSGIALYSVEEEAGTAEEETSKEHTLSESAKALTTVWGEKNCSAYAGKEGGYPLASIACNGNYTRTERQKFLDILFTHGYFLKKETYKLSPANGVYLYKTEKPESSGNYVFFKLYVRNAVSLWPETPLNGKQMAIFVQNLRTPEELIRWQTLGIPLTYGIVPGKKHSAELIAKVKEYGQEAWLTLPLESKSSSPADGRILTIEEAKSDEAIEDYLADAYELIDQVKGVTNRGGSLFSTNVFAVRSLLEKVRAKNITMFLDSTAYAGSVTYETARIMSLQSFRASANNGVKSGSADAFLSAERLAKTASPVILVSPADQKKFFENVKKFSRAIRKNSVRFARMSELQAGE